MSDSIDQIRKDIEFLLSFLPASEPSDVEPNLSPFFYFTGSYEGDVKIMNRVSGIKRRYGVIDHENEEDYAE